MGTDRMTEFEGPCRCGKGKVHIDYCGVDHGWPVSTPFWYETSVRCAECSGEYELQQRGSDFVFVAKRAIRERTALSAKAADLEKGLFKRPDVTRMLSDLTGLLDHQKSLAAAYRLLESVDLVYNTVATFRKHWSGSEKWVKQHASAFNLLRIMKVLGVCNEGIVEEITEIKRVRNAAQELPPPVGEPVYRIGG